MRTLNLSPEELLAKNSLLKREVQNLNEQVEWFKHQLFGKKSEKFVEIRNEEQLYFENFDQLAKVKPEEKQAILSHERTNRKSNGQDKITLPANLSIESLVLDIPEDQKVCSEIGKPLVKTGEEITSKLRGYYIKQIVRTKYALPQESLVGICIAPLPGSLLIRCQADESFFSDILTKKFNEYLPLYRILRNTQTKWDRNFSSDSQPMGDSLRLSAKASL